MWNNVIVKVVKEKHSDFFKVHVHLHIYVFITIPEAKKYSNREKSESIQHFIDEFKNHEVNDPEVLSLFAMPWVSNPTSHPVFSKYYAVRSFSIHYDSVNLKATEFRPCNEFRKSGWTL